MNPQYEAHERFCKSIGDMAKENKRLQESIKLLESVTNDPHVLWANWLRGSVTLPAGIGDVREYQERIKRLEDAGDELLYDNDDMANINRWHKAKYE